MKTIGNIFGTILTLIGVWRLFAAIDGYSTLRWVLNFPEIQRKLESLLFQGIVFIIIGVMVLLLTNLKKRANSVGGYSDRRGYYQSTEGWSTEK